MKATEQYFPVVLFIMLYKVVLTFESVDEILQCDHSSESLSAVFSFDTVYFAIGNFKGLVLSIMLHAPLLLFHLHGSEASIVQRRLKHNGQYWVFEFWLANEPFCF